MKLKQDGFKKIIDDIHDGLYIVDRNRTITFWNRAAERITGFSKNEVLGRNCCDAILSHVTGKGDAPDARRCPLAETMRDGTMREAASFLHHKNGKKVPVTIRASTLTDALGQVVGGVELFTDISTRLYHERKVRQLQRMTLLDPLTQLANRTCIEQELERRFDEFTRYGVPFGLLFMDIDHFRAIRTAHGPATGKRVLKCVADTFAANSRTFDLYGRWGGEEFIGIIRNITPESLTHLGNRLAALVEKERIPHGPQELHVTLSMGATIVRKDDTAETLAQRANALLYQSKAAGKNTVTYA